MELKRLFVSNVHFEVEFDNVGFSNSNWGSKWSNYPLFKIIDKELRQIGVRIEYSKIQSNNEILKKVKKIIECVEKCKGLDYYTERDEIEKVIK